MVLPGRIGECGHCKEKFVKNSPRQKRCPQCTNRRSPSAPRRQFVGVDGEGWTDLKDVHRYDQLSVGDRTCVAKDGLELTTVEIFDFLWGEYLRRPSTVIYVGFFLRYDFTHWLKGLPENRAKYLFTREYIEKRRFRRNGYARMYPVEWEEWEFDILNECRFKLRRKGTSPWMYINDVGSYFQTSLLRVIDPRNWPEPICEREEYEIIRKGKEGRSKECSVEERARDRETLRKYNGLENDLLARVVERLDTGLRDNGIVLDRQKWFGPGQAASQWLDSIGSISSKDVRSIVSEKVLDAARASYYGGWFEVFSHGHVGDVWEYDVNSAYPYAITKLPCLKHGKWIGGEGDRYTLVEAWVSGSDPICGTMPHRFKSGAINRPAFTSGWFWLHELKEAVAAGLIDEYEIRDRWGLKEECVCAPYETAMTHLYNLRKKVGKNTPQGKSAKIVYNSSYGKFAQSVGTPKWANPIYASLITSLCRTQILTAVSTHPRGTSDLIMVATDGVYFRSRHPSLDIDPERLGAWDETLKKNLTTFMPGIYWDDDGRERGRIKSRGVSARGLSACLPELDKQFSNLRKGTAPQWPSIDITIPFSFVGCRQALHRGKWWLAGHTMRNSTKTISSHPGLKRVDCLYEDNGILRSKVWSGGDPSLFGAWDQNPTTPYTGGMGMVDDDELGIVVDNETINEWYQN